MGWIGFVIAWHFMRCHPHSFDREEAWPSLRLGPRESTCAILNWKFGPPYLMHHMQEPTTMDRVRDSQEKKITLIQCGNGSLSGDDMLLLPLLLSMLLLLLLWVMTPAVKRTRRMKKPRRRRRLRIQSSQTLAKGSCRREE